jgi:hypothetical protein
MEILQNKSDLNESKKKLSESWKKLSPTHPPYFLSRSEGRVYPATKIPYLHIFVT